MIGRKRFMMKETTMRNRDTTSRSWWIVSHDKILVMVSEDKNSGIHLLMGWWQSYWWLLLPDQLACAADLLLMIQAMTSLKECYHVLKHDEAKRTNGQKCGIFMPIAVCIMSWLSIIMNISWELVQTLHIKKSFLAVQIPVATIPFCIQLLTTTDHDKNQLLLGPVFLQ